MRSLVCLVALTACSSPSAGTSRADGSSPGGDTVDGAVPGGDAGAIGHETPLATSQLCKLLSARNNVDPTANDVQHRANVFGADLGIPVAHDDRVYLFFGDTIGFKGIWGFGESHPDMVGYGAGAATATALATQPNLLCDNLAIETLAPSASQGPHADPSVVADFAAGAMAAPAGHQLGEYIRNPSGGGATTFPFLPGDFEVPSGAFSYGDSIYVFYTTVVGRNDITMSGSYLARWQQPAPGKAPNYQILYAVDERFDGSGPLGGNFINIAAEVSGDYVYLFGTGKYRASGVHVARKRLDALATPGGFEDLGEAIAIPGYGETSVHYFPALGRWMLLAEQSLPTSNRIVAHFAADPAGPWTTGVTVADMGDPAFTAAYCCATDDNCSGQQFFNCDKTGFYGTYLMPSVTVAPGSGATPTTFTATYTMSSFSPYNVALFQTTFTE